MASPLGQEPPPGAPRSNKRTLNTCSSTDDSKPKPFWNAVSKEWAPKLWSCVKTGLQELAPASWCASAQRLVHNSWFTVTMMTPIVPFQVSPCILDAVIRTVESDERQARTPKKPKLSKKEYEHPVRSRRIRIHPTEEQRQGLDSWFGSVRFCYNQLVAQFRTVGRGGVNLAVLRKVVADAELENPWLKEIPYDIKDVAVTDFDKARKAHFAMLKKKKDKDPHARHDASFKFRSRRDPQQSFEVRARGMVRKSGHFAFINLTKIKASEKLPDKLYNSVRFVRDRLNRYFLVVPLEVKPMDEPRTATDKIVSLDPGVRTFQTTYDASGLVSEWGKGDMSQIFRLCLAADKVQSAWQKKKGSKRRSTKRAWYRLLDKVRNKVKEVHCKMTKWLCEEYRVILIPKFESSRMARRGQRKINSKTVRSMLTWSHYKFREMLKAKAELYPWVKVVECDEAYTSKTCGSCGRIHQTLGGSKTFRCPHCQHVSDRDVNAARNIMLRYLSLKVREGPRL